jgi:hypothetical protein
MNPQGSVLVNPAYFTNLTASVNAAGSCEELQTLVTEAMGSINAMKAGIESELAKLSPILSLLTAPGADLGAIVTFLTNLISMVLTPLTLPTIN